METVWIVYKPKAHELVEDIIATANENSKCEVMARLTKEGRSLVFVSSSFDDATHVATTEVLRSLQECLGIQMPTAEELLDRKAYQEWLCDSHLDCVSG